MKMPDKIDYNMLATCGVLCLACGAHLRNKCQCPGCRAPIETISRKSCAKCAKKECAFERGIQWCFECDRFPCSRIRNLAQRYQQNYDVDLVQNGMDAKQDMTAFLQAQMGRFTCKSCGGIIDQHHRRCSDCGDEVCLEVVSS